MEDLSISEPGQGGQGTLGGSADPDAALGRMPQPPQSQSQLPAQMFTTAAQLLDLTDKKLMLVLRDGRKVMGILRSWDQFANLILQSAVERIFVLPESTPDSGQELRGLFADIPRGTFLVRGENVLLLGEIDLDKDDDPPPGYERSDPKVLETLTKRKTEESQSKEKTRLKKLSTLGFEGENMGEVLL